jgi:hypothetical protein
MGECTGFEVSAQRKPDPIERRVAPSDLVKIVNGKPVYDRAAIMDRASVKYHANHTLWGRYSGSAQAFNAYRVMAWNVAREQMHLARLAALPVAEKQALRTRLECERQSIGMAAWGFDTPEYKWLERKLRALS